jgi:hypothetical protein
MLAVKIIALCVLCFIWLSGCQGNRLSGSTSSFVTPVDPQASGRGLREERGVRLDCRPVNSSVETWIRELRAAGMGILKIGRTLGVGTSVVQRVRAAA